MKKTIIVLLVLAVVLVGGWFGYRYLSQSQKAEPLPEATAAAEETAETTETEEAAQPEDEQQPQEAVQPEQETADDATAPDFAMLDKDGNTVMLSDCFGKPTIVNFWATWCPPCKAEMPLLQKAYEQLGGEIGFVMVNLTDGQHDTPEAVAAFIEENGYTFPVYCDRDYAAGSLYNIQFIPMTFLLDSQGHILKEHTGQLDEQTLNEYMDLLAEEALRASLNLG